MLKTFLTTYRFCKWVVIPVSPTNALAPFIEIMNYPFRDILDKGVLVFLGIAFIYSNTLEKHFDFLSWFLAHL